jgi:poly(3-hydroxybutyrate) depolymerase
MKRSTRMTALLSIGLTWCACASPPPPQPKWRGGAVTVSTADSGEMHTERIPFHEAIYSYEVYVPAHAKGRKDLPVLMALHGKGGNGQWSIKVWKDFADEKGILLVAPTLDYSEQLEEEIPALLLVMLDEVHSRWSFDPRRVYLFGHSAGGVCGFDVAMMDSERFAAVAIHAAEIFPTYDWILTRAKRKTPIAYFIGDHDQFFSFAATRRTRDLLEQAGFPLRYVEIPDHDHTYETVAGDLDRQFWTYLSQYQLP